MGGQELSCGSRATGLILCLASTLLVGSKLLGGVEAAVVGAQPPGAEQSAAGERAAQVPILCYHDIRDDVRGDLDSDRYAVSTRALVEQFDWLLAHGYEPIGLDRLLAASEDREALPERPIVLTFDDGFASFYDIVFPLLRQFRFPAVLSVVGSWLEVEAGGLVPYAGGAVARERFVTWQQLAELAESPWVEIASHSHDLHRGILANSWGNQLPAAVTPIYNLKSGGFETPASQQQRLRQDLQASITLIEKHIGHRPRTLAWPYGESSGWGNKLALELGFEVTLLLGNEMATIDGRRSWKRVLVYANPGLADWVRQLRQPFLPVPKRGLRIRLRDLTPGDDRDHFEHNLGNLVSRAHGLQINTLYLADLWGENGGWLATTATLGRISWQLRTRAGARVWAWLGKASSLDESQLEGLAREVPLAGWVLALEPDSEVAPYRRIFEVLRRYRHDGRLAVALEVDRLFSMSPKQAGTVIDSWRSVADHVVLVEGEKVVTAEAVGQWLMPWRQPTTQVAVLLRNQKSRPVDPWAIPDLKRCRRLQVAGMLSAIVDLPWQRLPEKQWSKIRPLISTANFPYRRP